MIVFCLCKSGSSKKGDVEYTWIHGKEVSFGYKKVNFPSYCVFEKSNKSCFFSSAHIVVDKNNSYTELTEKPEGISLKELLPTIQNNIVGLEFNITGNDFAFFVNSARISRARMFFLVSSDAIYFSPDLRLLLPYSARKLRHESAYSIIKYGDVPEYLSVVEDIFAIPVSTYLTINSEAFLKYLRDRNINIDDFEYYFKLSYPMDGGNIEYTKELFEKQAQYIADKDVAMLVSGGVDSSLTNFMVNEYKNSRYPAYFIYYGENDDEITYAKKAVQNTKAELNIVEFSKGNIIHAFKTAATRLIQPVGENSPIDGAVLYDYVNEETEILIDCTSADGCYGSRNYLQPLYRGMQYESNAINALTERIAIFLQQRSLRGQYRLKAKDSLMKDQYIRMLHEYIGPFGNLWFDQASSYVEKIQPYFTWYYSLIDGDNITNDTWAKYTIFKLVHYASKQTIAKTYDIRFPESYTIFPFMWLDILSDQGHYSWRDKTKNGIIKYPLKKILEKYIESDFVHREKVGLNSKLMQWIMDDNIRDYISMLVLMPGGVGEVLIGKKRCLKLIEKYRSGNIHYFMKCLLMGIAMQQNWCEANGIRIG